MTTWGTPGMAGIAFRRENLGTRAGVKAPGALGGCWGCWTLSYTLRGCWVFSRGPKSSHWAPAPHTHSPGREEASLG